VKAGAAAVYCVAENIFVKLLSSTVIALQYLERLESAETKISKLLQCGEVI
jgi:hypothetical protein